MNIQLDDPWSEDLPIRDVDDPVPYACELEPSDAPSHDPRDVYGSPKPDTPGWRRVRELFRQQAEEAKTLAPRTYGRRSVPMTVDKEK